MEIRETMNLQDYHEKGYILIPKLFSAEEIEAFSLECDRLLNDDIVSPENGRTPFRFGAEKFPERIDPVVDISPFFNEVSKDQRIMDVLEQIFKEKALLLKDKLIFKGPGVEGYTLHQDYPWGWQNYPADLVLSVSIQIDGANADNGGIEMFDGYHDKMLTPPGKKMNFSDKEKAILDYSRQTPLETNPGDVLIFHSLTPHQSGTNTSNRWRRSLYLAYNGESLGNERDVFYEDYMSDQPRHQGKYFK